MKKNCQDQKFLQRILAKLDGVQESQSLQKSRELYAKCKQTRESLVTDKIPGVDIAMQVKRLETQM
jgi:hypothetical protein